MKIFNFSKTFKNEVFKRFEISVFFATNPSLFRSFLRFEKHCVLKILVHFGPPQAEIFEDLGGCFMQKIAPDCLQKLVFRYKTHPKCKKDTKHRWKKAKNPKF